MMLPLRKRAAGDSPSAVETPQPAAGSLSLPSIDAARPERVELATFGAG